MLAFIGQPKNKNVINHKNGIKHDNRLENLEYCSQSHNRKQDFINGRQTLAGEKNTQAKLTSANVFEIRKLIKSGFKYSELASQYNVSISSISNIFNKYTWNHL